MISGNLVEDCVYCDFSDEANELFSKNQLGVHENKKLVLSLIESAYVLDKEKISIKSGRKTMDFESFFKKASKKEENFRIKYIVFKDMRDRGYIVKTALKFGADFRVYDRGVKPGEDHAIWVVFPVSNSTKFSWSDFAAKTRVAHSTKKRLLIALVDEESDVTYYEIAWKRP